MPQNLPVTLGLSSPGDTCTIIVLDTAGVPMPDPVSGITIVPTDPTVVAIGPPDSATGRITTWAPAQGATVGASTTVTVTVPGLPPQTVQVNVGPGAATGVVGSFSLTFAATK